MESDFLQRRSRRRAFYSQSHETRHHGSEIHPDDNAAPSHSAGEKKVHINLAANRSGTEQNDPEAQSSGSNQSQPNTKHHHRLRQWLRSLSTKQRVLFIGLLVVFLAIIACTVYYFVFRKNTPVTQAYTTQKAVKKAIVAPVVYYSPLTGLPVDAVTAQNPITGVMIENSETARPQSGLIDAGVVFEAVAEGGITRFLMLFQDTSPDYIGPVRSVRPYYIKWANGFDAPIAHVGGSGDALAMIRAPGGKDLDQFFNPAPYWRISSRPAPHNMYSSIPQLRALQDKKGWSTSKFTGFERKAKEQPVATPTAKTIDFNISGPIYNSHYDYDAASNSYLRSEGGKPHTDEKSGHQIQAKVVIGLVMPQGNNGIYTTYETIGSGHVYVFQDGVVTEGTWEKTSNESQFVFKDTSGAVIKLNAGKTWLTVIGATSRVTFKP